MTALPEPSFIERDPEGITREMILQYEQLTGKTLRPAQVERLMINLIAYRETLVRHGIQEAAKQCMVAYARYPMLDYLGELLGVARLPAQAARTTLRFTLTGAQTFGVLIPSGTRIETKDGKQIFRTDEDLTIAAGQTTGDVAAAAETAGSEANGYSAGEIATLLAPLAYVSGAENTAVSFGGSDAEADDRLRQRIREAPEAFSNAGSKGAYRFWALSAHTNIVDVAVTSPAAGTVNVYPLLNTGTPPQEILDAVEAVLTDDTVRPLTDQVSVLAPTRWDFALTADVTLYADADAETVQDQVQEKLDTYVAFLKAGLGRDVVTSQIIALINGVAGVYKVQLTSPAADRVIDADEWANCTAVTVNYVGSANG